MKKKDSRIEALKTSTEYGNAGLVKTLLFAVNPEEILMDLLNKAVMADSPETVQILVDRYKDELRKIDASVIDNVIAKAVDRRNEKILKMLEKCFEKTITRKDPDDEKFDQLLDRIPKHEEFKYVNNLVVVKTQLDYIFRILYCRRPYRG